MKNIIQHLLAVLLSILLLSSCIQEPADSSLLSKNTFSFKLTLPNQEIVETRSGNDDKTINNIYVVVFDGNQDTSNIIDYAECSLVSSTYYAKLKPETQSGYIAVLANVATEISSNGGISTWTTLGDVRNNLKVQLKLNSGNIIEAPAISPMSSGVLDFTNGFPEDNILNVELIRSTSKITVVNKATTQLNYTLEGANMGNAPTMGYVAKGVKDIVSPNLANYAGLDYGSSYSIEKMMVGASIDQATGYGVSEPLYLFESVKANEPFVIIKGNFNGLVSYHRLNIWNRNTEQYINIERNCHYIINISKVHTAGYRTAQEAINAPASNRNIDYEIEITNPNAHDITTNGEQYLTFSNSNFITYHSNVMYYVIVTKISYTVPQGANKWQDGLITAVGEGMVLENGNATMPLIAQNTTDLDVKVHFTKTFTKGYVDIRIGDLAKRINVEKRNNLNAIPAEIEFNDAISADRTTAGAIKNAIRFANEPGKYQDKDNYNNIFAGTTNKIYALISGNVGYRDNITERSSEFYVTSSKDGGRTKVVFYQNKMDIYSQLTQIKPHTYIGTFHRADETAERIIRILPINPDPKTTWSAVVVVGQDFIELNTNDSPDTGINKYNTYGYDPANPDDQSRWDNPKWTTAAEVEANCQFKPEEKNKIFVSGTGDLIYLRVGMKSKLPGGASAKPRYGLIAIQHADGSHLIYVRQGEAADYLMRPEDGVLSGGISSGNRILAKKIQPYNLTVPADKRHLKSYDIPANSAVPTDYPSQGGYLFQGNSQRAFYPVGTATEVNWTDDSGNIAGSAEICPNGYRRPADGVSNNTVGAVNDSEIRQSFWLNPQSGEAFSSFSNMLRGYIADGYFDRHVIRVPNTQGHSNEGTKDTYSKETIITNNISKTYTIPTLVGEDSEIGYAGMLIFNPNNYASIFIPSTGSRNGQTFPKGDLAGTGAQSNIWSSTYYSSNQMWYLATGFYANGFVFDNYRSRFSMVGLSVRCVKDSNN